MGTILAGVADLLFRSKIEETAKQTGAKVKFVREAGDLLNQARFLKPDLIVLDLEAPSLSPVETIQAIRREEPIRDTRIIGFCSHVDDDTMKHALAAGCTETMPRGEFTRRLPEILKP